MTNPSVSIVGYLDDFEGDDVILILASERTISWLHRRFHDIASMGTSFVIGDGSPIRSADGSVVKVQRSSSIGSCLVRSGHDFAWSLTDDVARSHAYLLEGMSEHGKPCHQY